MRINATKEVQKDIVARYVDKLQSIETIKNAYSVSRNVIKEILKLNNVEIRTNASVQQRLEQYKDEIIKKYTEDNLSLRALGAEYNTTDSTMMRFLNNNDISTSKRAKIIDLSQLAV